MFEKLEELQNKPRHEKSKIFWTTLVIVIPLVLLLGLGLSSLSFGDSLANKQPALQAGYLDDLKNTIDSSKELFTGTQEVIGNAKNLAGTIISPAPTSTDGAIYGQDLPPATLQPSNNVYFLPSPNQ